MRFLTLLLLLGACGSVSLSTIVQLSRLDPLTADPSGFVAAVVLPQELDIPEGGATLGFTWVSADETLGGDFPLRRHMALDSGPIPHTPDQQVLFFDLAPEDAAAIRQAQQEITARKAAGVAGEGTFSVFAAPCARGLPGQALISTYLRVEDGGAFLPLLQDYDIRQKITEEQLGAVASCG